MRLINTFADNTGKVTLTFRKVSTEITLVVYRCNKKEVEVPSFSVSEVLKAATIFMQENIESFYRRKLLIEKIKKDEIIITKVAFNQN